MALKRIKPREAYGLGQGLIDMTALPIVAQRAPRASDRAEFGTIWIDQPNNDVYLITSVTANVSNWEGVGGGAEAPHSLASDTFVTAGSYMTVGTTLTVTGMAANGVVTNTAAGLFVTNPLLDGEILIGATGAAPIAATLTAGAGIAIVEAANAITITATGATAVSYTASDANVAVPDGAGNVNVLGGTNIGTTAAIANTVTVNLDDAVTLAGLLTCDLGLDAGGAGITLASITNAGRDIWLHADGGVAETIEIHSDQGTGVNALASIYIHSDDGGVTLDSEKASANAIVISATSAVGGILMSCGSGDFRSLTTGAITLTAAHSSTYSVIGVAQDLTLSTLDGSVIVNSGKAGGDSIYLHATDAAGGISAVAGTGGLSLLTANGTVSISSGTAAINIGTDAATHTVTIGTTNTTARTVIQSGTGDTAITSTDAITVDATGLFSIDSAVTSNVTVTGASEDLQLYATGGSVLVAGSEAVATAISLDASDAAGGVTIAAGTSGLLFGNQADCTTIELGDFAPTAARTITIGGGTIVTTAVTDTIDIGPDGATTNANSIKTVNINTGVVAIGEVLTNVATGDVTSGTHTVEIQTGVVTAGTVVTNVSTGVGTKEVNFGNADGLTTVNIDAITLINDNINVATSINTGTSTGAVTIGNGAAGAIAVDTAAGISLDAATASNFTVTGAADLTIQSTLGGVDLTSALAAADAITLYASDAAGGVTTTCGTGGFLVGAVGGAISFDTTVASNFTVTGASENITLSSVGGSVDISATEDAANAILINCNGGSSETLQLTSTQGTGADAVSLDAPLGGITLTAGLDAVNAIVLNASDLAGGIDINCGSGGLNIGCALGPVVVTSGTGPIDISTDAFGTAINIATGAAVKALTLGSTNAESSVLIQSGTGDVALTSTDNITLDATGDIDLDAATIDLDAAGGALTATAATGTVAGVALTLDARVGRALFTGQTPAAAANIDFNITNAFAAAGKTILVTMAYSGAADCDITLEGVNLNTAGHLILHCQNNGSAQGDGDIQASWWILD